MFRKQLRQVADFCGVGVLTCAVMSNHFHILALVPQKLCPVDDSELLRRYSVLYPQMTKFQVAQIGVLRPQLAVNGPEAVSWRKRLLALMGDISQFMKIVKQCLSVWFHRSHGRYVTLWAERFKCVLVESAGRARKTVAEYVDLNAVRANWAEDPVDYRFCGYAEAVAGSALACEGLMQVASCRPWREAQANYRQRLFGTGADRREYSGRITAERLQ